MKRADDGPAQRLLITGTGGCGKRSLGRLLADELGFVHVDLDSAKLAHQSLPRRLAAALRPGASVVVTWTLDARAHARLVSSLQAAGFEWIWLDGDRGAGLPPGARFVDPFAPDGSFRP